MVVQQLHKKCQDRDKSARWHDLSEQKIKDLCLVAVIGGQEKCFRDDFKPLQLQNPWRRGKLYLRLRSEALAASSSGYFTSVWQEWILILTFVLCADGTGFQRSKQYLQSSLVGFIQVIWGSMEAIPLYNQNLAWQNWHGTCVRNYARWEVKWQIRLQKLFAPSPYFCLNT